MRRRGARRAGRRRRADRSRRSCCAGARRRASPTAARWAIRRAATGRRSFIARSAGSIAAEPSSRPCSRCGADGTCSRLARWRDTDVRPSGREDPPTCRDRSWCSAPAASSAPTSCACCSRVRDDVYGTTTRLPAWRLDGLPRQNVRVVDLLVDANLDAAARRGASRARSSTASPTAPTRSRPTASSSTRPTSTSRPGCSPRLETRRHRLLRPRGQLVGVRRQRLRARARTSPTAPNSDYAVSKVAAANLLHYYGKKKGLPCANLRLYSVYGPLEDSSRLIPNLVRCGARGKLSPLRPPDISRDFVYVDDVAEAFVDAALNLDDGMLRRLVQHRHRAEDHHRRGRRDRRARCSRITRRAGRSPCRAAHWDVTDWFADLDKAARDARLAAAHRRSATGCAHGATGTERCRTRSSYHQLVEALRPRHQAQRQRRSSPATRTTRPFPIMYERLKRHLRQAQHRLRDHLRQRLQPRRLRGGHPRHLARRPARDRHLPLAQLRLAGGLSQRHGDRHARTPACCSTAICRIRRS